MTGEFALRQLRFWLTNYRRTYRGSIYSSVLSPALYLGAMGLGLGKLVDAHGTAGLGGSATWTSSRRGWMAATAMQIAMTESTYPIFGSVKWLKTYQAAIATPLRPADLLHGHLLFMAMRLAMNAAVFVAVMAAFGAVHLSLGAGRGASRGAHRDGVRRADRGIRGDLRQGDVVRDAVPVRDDPAVPVFSGTFFPAHATASCGQPLAYPTPLWHGWPACCPQSRHGSVWFLRRACRLSAGRDGGRGLCRSADLRAEVEA